MKYLYTFALSFLFFCNSTDFILADKSLSEFVVQAQNQDCKHGLHHHPNNGPFSIFVFCDDALGTNIGLILTEPGAGPGKLKLEGTKIWDWQVNNRFWQLQEWSSDVTSFAWSPDFRYLYIATSSVYGDGSFFRLDLKNRTSKRLIPDKKAKYFNSLKNKSIRTRIVGIDKNLDKITVEIEAYWPNEETIAKEIVELN